MKNQHAQSLGSIRSERKAEASRVNGSKGGRPKKPMEIPLSQGKVALVDREDYKELMKWRWCARKGGNTYYAVRNEPKDEKGKYRTIWMHRIVMGTPDGMETDHINGDGLDNRSSNLRVCTKQENQRNAGVRRSNTSGFKGVDWYKKGWRARIAFKNKQKHLGLFTTKEEAYEAYCNACIELHGEFARLE